MITQKTKRESNETFCKNIEIDSQKVVENLKQKITKLQKQYIFIEGQGGDKVESEIIFIQKDEYLS